jgi:hypothetical protein
MRGDWVVRIEDFSNERGVPFLNRFIRKASRNVDEAFGSGRVTDGIT